MWPNPQEMEDLMEDFIFCAVFVESTTISDKIFGTKKSDPVKLDRTRELWYVPLSPTKFEIFLMFHNFLTFLEICG